VRDEASIAEVASPSNATVDPGKRIARAFIFFTHPRMTLLVTAEKFYATLDMYRQV